MGKLNDLSKDPLFMNASPDVQKQAVKGVVNRAFTEKYGSDALSKINLLPKEEQDAIYGDMASQINQKVYYGRVTATGKKVQPNNTGDFITTDEISGLDVFKDKRTYLQADTRSLAQKAFDESILSINAVGQGFSNIGDGIVQGLTGYDPNIANALKIGEARDDYGWLQDASAVPTGLVAGGLLGLAGSVAPWALPSWYGATQGIMANQENDKARDEALKTGDWQQYTNLTKKKGLAVGANVGAAVATSFIPAHLGGSLTKKALTGAALGAVQDEINNTAMNYASTGKVELQKPSVGLGTVMGGGFPLAGAGLKKLAGKRAKITEAPSQKQAVEALQNEAKNAPLASQRNRARATLGRMNPQYLKQPLQTTTKPASKPFKASLEAPQVVKKPVGIVPIKTKVKPPLKALDPIVGGLKKKVTPAKVAKPANVDVSKTETTTGGGMLDKDSKKWFGNSRAVDENGKPLTLYHGSPHDFKNFDKKKIGSSTDPGIRGKGFYFTPNLKTAQGYAKGETGVIKKVFLKMDNPIDLLSFKNKEALAEHLGFDASLLNERVDKLPSGDYRSISVKPQFTGQFTSSIKEKGYDGIIHGTEYTVFEPSQIKEIKEQTPPATKESLTVEPKPQETAVEPQTEKKLKAKVQKDTRAFASELKGAVKKGTISKDEAKNILYNLDDETKQKIVDEIGCHCHE